MNINTKLTQKVTMTLKFIIPENNLKNGKKPTDFVKMLTFNTNFMLNGT